MKLGFVIIAHDSPHNVCRLIRLLLASGSIVSLHFDARGGEAPVNEIRQELGELAGQVIWPSRVPVFWGEWSIIQATLNAVMAIFEAGEDPDYIHLMSAADYPLRPISDLVAFLERHKGMDFIESHDTREKKWVVDGLSEERYRYRHYFNFKSHPQLFDWNWKLQRFFKLKRKLPKGLNIHMGSQWCTLTGASWKYVLKQSKREDIKALFQTSWIPDEMYVQSLLAMARTPHSNLHLTLYQFSDYGVPIVYYDDHLQHLLKQPFFFARKLSPQAESLREELDLRVRGITRVLPLADAMVGKPTHDYHTFRKENRNGRSGIRTPGLIRDPWYGDLEWATVQFTVFFGVCDEELMALANYMNTQPGYICHGRLFKVDRIEFAMGTPTHAGYRHDDVLLRDHKRTNFLVDVVSASPEQHCCFLMKPEDDDGIFNTLRWSKLSRFVFLRGSLIRVYCAEKRANFVGDILFEEFCDEASKKIAHYNRQAQESGSNKLEVDLLNDDWHRLLSHFMGAANRARNTPTGLANELPSKMRSGRLPLTPISSLLMDDLIQELLTKESKYLDRVKCEIMNSERRSYLILLGETEVMQLISHALERSGVFRNAGMLPTSAANFWIKLIGKASAEHMAHDVFICDQRNVAPLLLACSDTWARIISLIDPKLSLRQLYESELEGTETGMAYASRIWCEPHSFKAWLSEYKHQVLKTNELLSTGLSLSVKIDLQAPDWSSELLMFLQGTFASANLQPESLSKALADVGRSRTFVNAMDPSAAFLNWEFLQSLDREVLTDNPAINGVA